MGESESPEFSWDRTNSRGSQPEESVDTNDSADETKIIGPFFVFVLTTIFMHCLLAI